MTVHDALDVRGVTTTATVLRYSYDPGGGDPGGWTTDRIGFSTATGAQVVATVGHHAAGPERFSRTLEVTYDPRDPRVVRAAGHDDPTDDPGNAVVAGASSVLLTGAAVFLLSRVLTTGRSEITAPR